MEINTKDVTVEVPEANEMRLYVAEPQSSQVQSAVIVLQEAFGLTPHIKDIAERLAKEGYLAVAPELFHRTAPVSFQGSYADFESVKPHTSQITQKTLEADIASAYNWIAENYQECSSIASIGFCLGGRASYIANSILPLKAAISFYGGGLSGEILSLSAKQNAPILFFWGGLDKNIDSLKRRALIDSMDAAQKEYVNVVFSRADHGFMRPEGQVFDPKASEEAWALTTSFLSLQLKQTAIKYNVF